MTKPKRHAIKYGPDIPIQPLQDWVAGQLAINPCVNDLARRMGIQPRTLLRIRNGEQTGKLTVAPNVRKPVLIRTNMWARYRVEDMLERAGADFFDVYPQFRHEVEFELEPDCWCEECRDVTTPIGGVCPWCDQMVSKPQAGLEEAA